MKRFIVLVLTVLSLVGCNKAPEQQAKLSEKPVTTVVQEPESPKLLNVTYEQATEGFRDIMKFERANPINGLDHYMGDAHSLIMQCIGDKKNLSRIILTMIHDGRREIAGLNSIAITRLSQQVLHLPNTDQFLQLIKSGGGSFVADGKTVTMKITDINGTKAYVLEINA